MIVLDTHALVWWAAESAALPKRIANLINRNANEGKVDVSSVSTWEGALLVKKGRLRLAMDVADWVAKCEALPNLRFVAPDNRIMLRSVFLPGELHNDPADRIIVATALTLGAKLVSSDEKLEQYAHVETIW